VQPSEGICACLVKWVVKIASCYKKKTKQNKNKHHWPLPTLWPCDLCCTLQAFLVFYHAVTQKRGPLLEATQMGPPNLGLFTHENYELNKSQTQVFCNNDKTQTTTVGNM
jgi:hypothetical protein